MHAERADHDSGDIPTYHTCTKTRPALLPQSCPGPDELTTWRNANGSDPILKRRKGNLSQTKFLLLVHFQ